MAEETKKEEAVAESAETQEMPETADKKETNEPLKQKDISEARPGDMVKVYQKLREKNKDRTQVFEGQILARKHGKGASSTITVRKVIDGVGVEKIFPLHSPSIEKIEIVKHSKAKRAKLYYLRGAKGRKAKLKTEEGEE